MNDQRDIWTSTWGEYAPSKTYRFLVGQRNVHQVYNWLWKCYCQPKHKVFFWLLLKDRLSTRNILRRKNMQLDSFLCVLCNTSEEETCQHLFIDCPFAKQSWDLLNISFQNGTNINDCITQIRNQSHPVFFMMVAILMCWAIWSVRNDFIFRNIQPNVQTAKEIFRKEIALLSLRAKTKDSITFDLWIQNLL